jgi:hypothetical protein
MSQCTPSTTTIFKKGKTEISNELLNDVNQALRKIRTNQAPN